VVISDRYYDSTYAYQAGGRGLDLDTIKSINQWATDELKPDLTFLLDVDINASRLRSGKNNTKDRIESAEDEFFIKTRNMFLQLAKEDEKRFVVLDASKKVKEVNELIVNAMKKILIQKGYIK
jgi:dTMP kinase